MEGRPILAVIKNNAYGMGLINMARILESEASVTGMAVVRLNEAIELRDAGITKPILLMGPFDDADLEEAVMRDVMPMVYTEVGDALARLATRRQSAVPVQVCVDTGMGRVGIPYRTRGRVDRRSHRARRCEHRRNDDYAERRFRIREAAVAAIPGGRRNPGRERNSPWAGGMRLRATPCLTIRRRTLMWCGPAWRSLVSTRWRGFAIWTCSICGRP